MSRGTKVFVVGLTVCALALTASWASAQQKKGKGRPGGAPGGAGGGMAGMMGSPMFLLRSDAVQSELKLTDDQKAKLKDSMGGMRDLANADPAERQKKMADAEKTLQGILTPEQSARLKGISLQAGGVRALLGADVAQELGLSEDQKSKLQDIATKSSEQMRGLFGGGGAPSEDARAKMAQLRKQSEDDAMAVLTADQKAKLDKMKGPAFDVSALRGAGGGRRPGGNQ